MTVVRAREGLTNQPRVMTPPRQLFTPPFYRSPGLDITFHIPPLHVLLHIIIAALQSTYRYICVFALRLYLAEHRHASFRFPTIGPRVSAKLGHFSHH